MAWSAAGGDSVAESERDGELVMAEKKNKVDTVWQRPSRDEDGEEEGRHSGEGGTPEIEGGTV